MIADLGFILHWSLTELEACDWERLCHYHSLAMERFEISAKLHGAEVKT
jgi:hypothetical protein